MGSHNQFVVAPAPGQGDPIHGSAYVFIRSGATWSEQTRLTPDDIAADESDSFGDAVALSNDGSTALVGSPTPLGSAYVFTHIGATWSKQEKLTPSGGGGGSVALSSDGDTALTGAFGDDNLRGAAHVFTRSVATWTEQQKLTASDGDEGDSLGYAVALWNAGDTALVTALTDDTQRGAAYVFSRTGTSWGQQQRLTASDREEGDMFGSAAALSGDGGAAMIGAYGDDSFGGSAYTFGHSGTTWSEQQKLTASDSASNEFFGRSVALSSLGSTAYVGADGDNAFQGSAYVFSAGLPDGDHDGIPDSTDNCPSVANTDQTDADGTHSATFATRMLMGMGSRTSCSRSVSRRAFRR